ncbi:MAG: DUF3048 domain-containing protein, partial [Actinomycetota bacterium]|nr:DUF3048 domain-containing protein [Actinomycetota bacterium]
GPVIAAKIDNTSAGYQVQFGLSKADIVYVEQVEGGLTRLIALFHSSLPAEVGPIRSVRSTDSELLSSFGTPGLAFSGGAGGPLTTMVKTKIVDLSPDTHGEAYWRSQFGDGTHNLHVDLVKLAATAKLAEPTSPGYIFAAADPQLAAAAKVTTIQVTMEVGQVGFAYSGGHYLVSHHDLAYVDHNGTKIVTDNVLVQHVTDEPDGTVDTNGQPSLLSHTVGSGKFTLYRDGKAIAGTWKRMSATGSTSFIGKAGKPVLFKPGKTWVMLAPQSATVSVS